MQIIRLLALALVLALVPLSADAAGKPAKAEGKSAKEEGKAKKKKLVSNVELHGKPHMALLTIKQLFDDRCGFSIKLVGNDPNNDGHRFFVEDADGFTIYKEEAWPTSVMWVTDKIDPKNCARFIDDAVTFSFDGE